jgi:integrase/recombinase XerC
VTSFLAGRNARTLEAYRRDLEDFCLFVGAPDIDAAAPMLLALPHGEANALALAYRTHLVERGLQAATVNRRLAALRSLVQLANTFGMVAWSLEVENLKAQAYRDTRGPGRKGFRLMLEAAGNDRDRAMLRLLHDLGLRRGEVVGLDLADVDLEGSFVWILGKGRTQKEQLTLPEPTKAALGTWIAKRGAEPGPLFLNFDRARKGHRLTGAGLYHVVRKLGQKAGLEVHPHGLRHCGITQALDLTNGNVRAVQKFSRHRDLRILTLYDDNRLDLAGDVARLVAADDL